MNTLRERFEETNTAKIFLSFRIDFDPKANYYYTESEYKSDVDSLNAAYLMFQETNTQERPIKVNGPSIVIGAGI